MSVISIASVFVIWFHVGLSEGPQKKLKVDQPSVAYLQSNSRGIFVHGLTRNGRVVESYTGAVAKELGPGTLDRLRSQLLSDERDDAYTPVNDPFGVQPTIMGNLTREQLVYRGYFSTIFSVVDHPDLLIKYQSDCDEIAANLKSGYPYIHPLLREFWYSGDAAKHDLSVQVYTVSPPAPLCERPEGICSFMPLEATNESFRRCRAARGTIRYVVMRKSIGPTFSQIKKTWPNAIVPLNVAVDLGIALLEVIQDLHTVANVVHGDIHMGNIMIERSAIDPKVNKIKLIDYGRSFENFLKPQQIKYTRPYLHHISFTHWQLGGFHWAARDDVMKAIQVVADMMNPWSYMTYQEELLAKNVSDLISFQSTENLFAFPGYDPIEMLNVTNITKENIRNELWHILTLVRNLTDVNSIPPYTEIIDSFQSCLDYTQMAAP